MKQIRQAQSVSLNQSEKMADLRERGAAKEDSNEALRYQIKSMQAEIDTSRNRIRMQEDLIEQREVDLRGT